MGKHQSTLRRNGYVTEKVDPLIVAKGDDKFFIKKIILNKVSEELLLKHDPYHKII